LKSLENKLDIILQGIADNYTLEIANHYLNLNFVNNVIISCWEGNNIESNNFRITVLKNPLLEYGGLGNRNNQIISSFLGLSNAKTYYSIKMRSDQKISLDSMNLMYSYYEKYKIGEYGHKVGVAGIFKPFPFHPRDHIFWGKTEDLLRIFNIPLDNTKGEYKEKTSVRTETYICSYYFTHINPKVQIFIKHPEEYLTDVSPKINETMEISNDLIQKLFLPFPKIELEWPKYNMKNYHYEYTESVYGEYWGKI